MHSKVIALKLSWARQPDTNHTLLDVGRSSRYWAVYFELLVIEMKAKIKDLAPEVGVTPEVDGRVIWTLT